MALWGYPFIGLLKERVDKGIVSEDMLCEGMRRYHDRHDALEVLERSPDLAPPGNPPLNLPVALARPRKPAVN